MQHIFKSARVKVRVLAGYGVTPAEVTHELQLKGRESGEEKESTEKDTDTYKDTYV